MAVDGHNRRTKPAGSPLPPGDESATFRERPNQHGCGTLLLVALITFWGLRDNDDSIMSWRGECHV